MIFAFFSVDLLDNDVDWTEEQTGDDDESWVVGSKDDFVILLTKERSLFLVVSSIASESSATLVMVTSSLKFDAFKKLTISCVWRLGFERRSSLDSMWISRGSNVFAYSTCVFKKFSSFFVERSLSPFGEIITLSWALLDNLCLMIFLQPPGNTLFCTSFVGIFWCGTMLNSKYFYFVTSVKFQLQLTREVTLPYGQLGQECNHLLSSLNVTRNFQQQPKPAE